MLHSSQQLLQQQLLFYTFLSLVTIEPPPLPIRGTPLEPRSEAPKRPRASIITAPESTLPPRRRPTQRAPPIKPTTSFIFTGIHPLYRREVIQGQDNMMAIYYTQPAECLRAGTLCRKNTCPEEANTSVRLLILLGVSVVKKIITNSNRNYSKII